MKQINGSATIFMIKLRGKLNSLSAWHAEKSLDAIVGYRHVACGTIFS